MTYIVFNIFLGGAILKNIVYINGDVGRAAIVNGLQEPRVIYGTKVEKGEIYLNQVDKPGGDGLYYLCKKSSEKVLYAVDTVHFEKVSWESILQIQNQGFVFGITSGTVVEGQRLAEILGVTTYDGLVSQDKIKVVGNAYYDPNTKGMYLCKFNNRDKVPSSPNYEAIDCKSLRESINQLKDSIKSLTLEIQELKRREHDAL